MLVWYANNFAALIVARDTELVQLKLNSVKRTINAWMLDHALSLALNKSEIIKKPTAKNLRVLTDRKLCFGNRSVK